MADDVTVRIGADVPGAVGGIGQVTQSLLALRDAGTEVSEFIGGLGRGLAAGFTVAGIVSFVNTMTELGSATESTSVVLGEATKNIAGLRLAAQESGSTLEGVSQGMSRLEQVMLQSRSGNRQATADLAALNLTYKDFEGLNTQQKLELLADRFSELSDSTEKTALAQAVLGRAGAQMLPLLNEGAEGIREFNEIAARAGSNLSKEQVAGMVETGRAALEMGESFRGVAITVFEAFKPAIDAAIKVITDITQAFNRSLKDGSDTASMLDAVATAAKGVAVAITVASAGLQTLWDVGRGVVANLGDAFVSLGRVIYNAMTGNFAEAGRLWDEYGKRVEGRVVDIAKNMTGVVDNLKTQLRGIFEAEDAEEESNANKRNVRRKTFNDEAVAATMKRIETEIALERTGLQRSILLLETSARLGVISQQEKTAAVMRYTEASYQAQLRLMQQEAEIDGLKPAQKAEILGRIRQLQATHENDMIQLNLQSVTQMMNQWRQYTDAVLGSVNGQLRGLITMQTSWGQAMKNVLLDVGLQMITLLVTKPLAQFLAAKAAMLFAEQSTSGAMVATEAAAAAASLPIRAGKFVSDITASAAATFAGVFANLAPFLGPAASGPAAAAQGTVLAQLANVPKFDVGAWSVPGTGLAVVHQGETILPAGAPAEAYRNQALGGGIGGGGGMSFHISALDGASVARWLKGGGARQIAMAVAAEQNRNPGARPSY